jgi:hypothetical protein
MKHTYKYGCESRLEENVAVKVNDIFGAEFEVHPKISECVFNLSGEHAVDFLLPKHQLYIEVKGQMTLYTINKMLYLYRLFDGTDKWFYIFQATEEAWMTPLDDVSISNEERKRLCESNKVTQYDELNKLVTGEISAEELSRRSRIRLENYMWHRSGDLSRWRELHREKFGKALW